MTKVRIYTDGASRGNPGEAGIGVYIVDEQGKELARISDYLGKATNNVAEYKAMLTGLQAAINLGAQQVEIVADSELMVKQMKGLYKVKNEGLIPLYQTAKEFVGKFQKVAFTHVLREHNKVADQLANQGIDSKQGSYQQIAPIAPQQDELFDSASLEVEVPLTTAEGREILATGERLQLVRFTLKQGMELTSQSHVQEQAVFVSSGKVMYSFGGHDYTLAKGDSLIIPGGKKYQIKVLEDAITVNCFTVVSGDV